MEILIIASFAAAIPTFLLLDQMRRRRRKSPPSHPAPRDATPPAAKKRNRADLADGFYQMGIGRCGHPVFMLIGGRPISGRVVRSIEIILLNDLAPTPRDFMQARCPICGEVARPMPGQPPMSMVDHWVTVELK